MKIKPYLYSITIWISLGSFQSCSAQISNRLSQDSFQVSDELRVHIQEMGKTWGEAIKSKDIGLIEKVYDKNVHYLPDNQKALHGLDAVVDYWEGSLSFFADLNLKMETLEGVQELLYETGTGTAMIMNDSGNFDEFKFKYVNIWKQQSDGKYKVVVDIFNDVERQ